MLFPPIPSNLLTLFYTRPAHEVGESVQRSTTCGYFPVFLRERVNCSFLFKIIFKKNFNGSKGTLSDSFWSCQRWLCVPESVEVVALVLWLLLSLLKVGHLSLPKGKRGWLARNRCWDRSHFHRWSHLKPPQVLLAPSSSPSVFPDSLQGQLQVSGLSLKVWGGFLAPFHCIFFPRAC